MRKRNVYSRIIQNVTSWGENYQNFEKGKMINLLYHCIEHDITSFDTSDFSGKPVGRTFGTALSESGFGRDNIQIISKFRSTENQKDLISFVDELLVTLRTDYLDLLLLEYPSQPEKLRQNIEQLSSQGKILEIGGLELQKQEITNLNKILPVYANQTKLDFFSSETGKILEPINSISEELIQMVLCDFNDSEKSSDREGVFTALSDKYEVNTTQLLLSWILNHSSHLHPVITFTEEKSISNTAAAKKIDLDLVDGQKINSLLY